VLVRLHAGDGGSRRVRVLVDAVLGVLSLVAPLRLRVVAAGSAAAARRLLLRILTLRGALILVDSLPRLVLVRGAGVRRRAVALIDVAVASVAQHPDGRVHVGLHAGSGGGRRIGVLIDAVLRLLTLPTPLTLREVAGRRAVAAAGAFLLGSLRLRRALILLDSLPRVVLVLSAGIGRGAVALVDVAVIAVTADAHRCVHVRLDARGGRC